MNADRKKVFALALGLIVLAGCGRYEPAQPSAVKAPEPTKQAEPAKPTATPETTPPADANRTTAEPAAPETVQQKAEVGVGKKGRDYGPNILTMPVSVYFTVQERVVFDIEIPKAMQLFKAAEGRAPKTHEEFMQKIIKDNDIQLPELRAGHRYVYDPKQEELMVESPAKP